MDGQLSSSKFVQQQVLYIFFSCFQVEEAERKNLLLPGGTIFEGTGGNTGIGMFRTRFNIMNLNFIIYRLGHGRGFKRI
jgi:hypothetical protein